MGEVERDIERRRGRVRDSKGVDNDTDPEKHG